MSFAADRYRFHDMSYFTKFEKHSIMNKIFYLNILEWFKYYITFGVTIEHDEGICAKKRLNFVLSQNAFWDLRSNHYVLSLRINYIW